LTDSPNPAPKSNPRVRAALAVLAVLVVGGTVYLALDAFSSGSVFFRYVDEAVRERPEIGDRKIKVSGSLVAGSVETVGDGGRRFTLERNGVRLTIVSPDPSLPEGFGAPGQDVIVDGTFAPDGSLSATLVTTGCPSKYEARKAAPSPTQ
jgi:cytochrome c-type biogenesis protein CcmE